MTSTWELIDRVTIAAGGWIFVAALNKKEHFVRYTSVNDPFSLYEFMEEYGDRANLYYCLNPITRAVVKRKILDVDVLSRFAMVIDIDDHHSIMTDMEFEDLCTNVYRFIGVKALYVLRTSDHGIQMVYRYTDDEERLKRAVHKIARKFPGGKTESEAPRTGKGPRAGIDVNSTALCQLVRIPKSINRNHGKPFQSTVIQDNSNGNDPLTLDWLGSAEPVMRTERIKRKGTEHHPPCMRRIMDRIMVSPDEKLVIALFLIRVGWSVDEIVTVFSDHVDFDERETRRRIEYMSSRPEPYKGHACDTMHDMGLCMRHEHEYCCRATTDKRPPRHPIEFVEWHSWDESGQTVRTSRVIT